MTEAPPDRPRRQPPDVRREQLLDATEQLIDERGIKALTVAEVAARAGVAKGTTYLYFPSKDALIAGVRARYLEAYGATVEPDPDQPALDQVLGLLERLIAFAAERHRVHHALFHEAGFSEEDAFARLRSALAALVEQGVARGELQVDDVAAAATYVVGGVHDVLVDALHADDPAELSRATRAALDLTTRVLAPAGAAPERAPAGPATRRRRAR